MFYIKKFDPWQSRLCTCPSKWTFNPYTGCSHRCIYCYASTYIKKFFDPRPKKINLKFFEEEARKIRGMLISISNSTDPYQSLEKEMKITRKILEILIRNKVRIEIVTKSDLILRDLNVIKGREVVVLFTITTLNEKIAKKIEPFAPLPKRRIKAIKVLVNEGIPVVVRYDPIIPFLNDKERKLVKKLGRLGVKQIISSTLKIKPKIWQRISIKLPKIAEKLRPLYFEKGEKIGSYYYLPRDFREKILRNIKTWVEESGMYFSVCREGLNYMNSAKTCDGSWLIFKK